MVLRLIQIIALVLSPFFMSAMSPASAQSMEPSSPPCMERSAHHEEQTLGQNDCSIACAATLAFAALPRPAPSYATIDPVGLPADNLGSVMIAVPLPPPRKISCS
jgi:hypothetical protein